MKVVMYKHIEEPIIRLRLRQCGSYVLLEAMHENGNPVTHGMIAKITEDGCIELFKNMNPDIGLSINEYGEIVTKPRN